MCQIDWMEARPVCAETTEKWPVFLLKLLRQGDRSEPEPVGLHTSGQRQPVKQRWSDTKKAVTETAVTQKQQGHRDGSGRHGVTLSSPALSNSAYLHSL